MPTFPTQAVRSATTRDVELLQPQRGLAVSRAAAAAQLDDKRGMQIPAFVMSSDGQRCAFFDAVESLSCAADVEIVALARNGFADTELTDVIVLFAQMVNADEALARVIEHEASLCSQGVGTGPVCQLHPTSTKLWLASERPQLYAQLQAGQGVSQRLAKPPNETSAGDRQVYLVNGHDESALVGMEARIVRWITEPEPGFDLEALPMIQVQILNSERTADVWADELRPIPSYPPAAQALVDARDEQARQNAARRTSERSTA